jgi:hypothetical protein
MSCPIEYPPISRNRLKRWYPVELANEKGFDVEKFFSTWENATVLTISIALVLSYYVLAKIIATFAEKKHMYLQDIGSSQVRLDSEKGNRRKHMLSWLKDRDKKKLSVETQFAQENVESTDIYAFAAASLQTADTVDILRRRHHKVPELYADEVHSTEDLDSQLSELLRVIFYFTGMPYQDGFVDRLLEDPYIKELCTMGLTTNEKPLTNGFEQAVNRLNEMISGVQPAKLTFRSMVDGIKAKQAWVSQIIEFETSMHKSTTPSLEQEGMGDVNGFAHDETIWEVREILRSFVFPETWLQSKKGGRVLVSHKSLDMRWMKKD